MKKLFIIDAGHGGIINGQYVTPGKRSPEFDGVVMYEGIFNRAVAGKLIGRLESAGVPFFYLNSNLDIPLEERVLIYNKLKIEYSNYELVLISIHANAATSEAAHGVEVFTSPGQTKSDGYAEVWFNEFMLEFKDEFTLRIDRIDGDSDKEAKFYVITETIFPAFLIEHGFMTNYAECAKLRSNSYRDRYAAVIYQAITKILLLN